MSPCARYFNAAESLIRIMCEFDEDAKILRASEPNAKSKRSHLPPITKPEEVPKRTDKLGKYLVVSNQKALQLNQKDLKGEIKEQDSIFVLAHVFTSLTRKHFVDGIKQVCEAKKIVLLVKKCQDVYSTTLYYLFSTSYSPGRCCLVWRDGPVLPCLNC